MQVGQWQWGECSKRPRKGEARSAAQHVAPRPQTGRQERAGAWGNLDPPQPPQPRKAGGKRWEQRPGSRERPRTDSRTLQALEERQRSLEAQCGVHRRGRAQNQAGPRSRCWGKYNQERLVQPGEAERAQKPTQKYSSKIAWAWILSLLGLSTTCVPPGHVNSKHGQASTTQVMYSKRGQASAKRGTQRRQVKCKFALGNGMCTCDHQELLPRGHSKVQLRHCSNCIQTASKLRYDDALLFEFAAKLRPNCIMMMQF